MVIRSLCLCFLIAVSGCFFLHRSSPMQTGQYPAVFNSPVSNQLPLNYLVYIPESYNDSSARWPLLLFLHGAGERGNDIEKVKMHGPPKLIEAGLSFPFIIVSPQCPPDEWWDVQILNSLLDDCIARYRVDTNRVYVSGLSMGGFGTWNYAATFPDRCAAIAPICGGGNPENASKLKHIPAWVFHGALDDIVPVSKSQEMVDALSHLDASVRFTVYPDTHHDSWTETYANPELYEWLLSQHRNNE